MSESEWFIVPNLSDFTDKARNIVYNNFGTWQKEIDTDIIIEEITENEKEEFDKILSHQESLTIVKEKIKKEKNKKTKKYRYLLNDKIFADIVHQLNERMTSNIVNGLVQKGLIETAFDSESNDFIFWIKEDENQKPKTD
jgi:ABC-type Fe3+-citrate transport system substrate-binding protein